MRTIPIAVAAIALLSGAAFAQTPHNSASPSPPPSHSGGTTPGSAATAPAPKPAVNPLTQEDVSKIEGTAVYGSDKAKTGSIAAVLMDPNTKKIEKLVVAVGGVFGIGSHRVALPVDQFTWDSALGAFKISQTEASLKNMPEWVEGHPTATGSSEPPKATAPAATSKPAAPAAGNGDSKPGNGDIKPGAK